ncbi:hypothetical protein AYI69_g7314 [Smittium culicis]|uniref:Uncharacterized protein n=1 Tax=Smittium culicis TaxID=133412 RepID=A0A1R1XSW0_9FUNG|nr:hypothetical protein AYI69_g7314 [Smittium culicis]
MSLVDSFGSIIDFAENILIHFGEIQTSFKIDNRRKILFLKFINQNDLENANKITSTYKTKNMNLFETTEYSDEFKSITMPSCSGLIVWKVAHKEHEELSNIGEVMDIAALKYKNITAFTSNYIKIILKRKKR